MISPAQAIKMILKKTPKPTRETLALKDVLNSVLALDLKAPFDFPISDHSAMDGYAICAEDSLAANSTNLVRLKMLGTLKAGDSKNLSLKPGTSCRIMTGAVIPRGATAVIPKEEALLEGNLLLLHTPTKNGRHIRRKGEEIKKGQILLKKGTLLDPAAVGLLASFGFDAVPVYRKPLVAVLSTGNELVKPGNTLPPGKIYDSNSWMIRAALLQMHLNPVIVSTLKDQTRLVRQAIRKALCTADFLILTGGVSVGDYDFVKEALFEEGVETLFWKVSQKPGKPLFFGQKGEKIVFGLPGNPAASFTCFYEYVAAALLKFSGQLTRCLSPLKVKVEGRILSDPTKDLFLKARFLERPFFDVPTVEILAHQGSHMLSSLLDADGFLRVPAGKIQQSKEELFEIDLLPYKRHLV